MLARTLAVLIVLIVAMSSSMACCPHSGARDGTAARIGDHDHALGPSKSHPHAAAKAVCAAMCATPVAAAMPAPTQQ